MAYRRRGSHPLWRPYSRGLSRHRTQRVLCKLQLGPRPDFKFELLPLHSPLLGQSLLVSFPPLIDMLKFSGYSYLIRGPPIKILVAGGGAHQAAEGEMRYCARAAKGSATVFRGARLPRLPNTGPGACRPGPRVPKDARAGMPARILAGAMCVQRFDDSLNSAIHITYRISLRSSSMPEPRDPLLKVLTYLVVHSEFDAEARFWLRAFGGCQPRKRGGRRRRMPARRRSNIKVCPRGVWEFKLGNHPSAGSPTETLLRLLLPLNDRVWRTSQP